jgi:hypothetical protein
LNRVNQVNDAHDKDPWDYLGDLDHPALRAPDADNLGRGAEKIRRELAGAIKRYEEQKEVKGFPPRVRPSKWNKPTQE